MNKDSQTFKTLVARIVSGEITRNQACAESGLSYSTLTTWMRRAKIAAPRDSSSGGIAAAKAAAFNADPDNVSAMQHAVDRVTNGEMSAYAAAKADPRVNLSTLNLRLRKLREANGQSPRARGRPTNPTDAVEAVRLARLALKQAEYELELFLSGTK